MDGAEAARLAVALGFRKMQSRATPACMKKPIPMLAAAIALTVSANAQEPDAASSPSQIVASAPATQWVDIAADDLLVMTLAPDRDGNPRKVVLQLMPAPFSQGWIANIRTLARASWYDGNSINRVQDNYVVQWGNASAGDEGKTRPLPALNTMGEDDYVASGQHFNPIRDQLIAFMRRGVAAARTTRNNQSTEAGTLAAQSQLTEFFVDESDAYAEATMFIDGWPIGLANTAGWPVHCYGMVGVGRDYSPDTGSGAELYTVIGHAPRHLDRNIALVGRVVEGIEHLASLPRGSGELGFYTEEEADKRVPIQSVRIASDLPEAERPRFAYLLTEGETFARYAKARANRRDPFFIVPAGGADICNIPVPVRRTASGQAQ